LWAGLGAFSCAPSPSEDGSSGSSGGSAGALPSGGHTENGGTKNSGGSASGGLGGAESVEENHCVVTVHREGSDRNKTREIVGRATTKEASALLPRGTNQTTVMCWDDNADIMMRWLFDGPLTARVPFETSESDPSYEWVEFTYDEPVDPLRPLGDRYSWACSHRPARDDTAPVGTFSLQIESAEIQPPQRGSNGEAYHIVGGFRASCPSNTAGVEPLLFEGTFQ
jgi:hypothetical protein